MRGEYLLGFRSHGCPCETEVKRIPAAGVLPSSPSTAGHAFPVSPAGRVTGRNHDAIKKTVAGLLKLIHPHRTPESMTREVIIPLMEFAVEMRKRVIDQLAVMKPEEFRGVDFHSWVVAG